MRPAEAFHFHGMPAVRWRSPDGASAIATMHGAQLLSWVPAQGEECLYLSPLSPFEAGRPIRGGVPVIFPQFADRGPLAQHGFARVQAWSLASASESVDTSSVTFALESSAQTLALWPGVFRLKLTITIGGPNLEVQLRVTNKGTDPFAFTSALHTYLRISEATARLRGLQGGRYLIRGANGTDVESREMVTAEEAIDRVYFATPPSTQLEDAGRVLRIGQRGFTDTVVWNPGRERTAQMVDMPPDDFRRMLCVEAASIEPPVSLNSGAAWVGSQSIAISYNG